MKVATEKGRVVGICKFCEKPVHAHKFKIYRNRYCHIRCFDENVVGKIRRTKTRKQRTRGRKVDEENGID